MTIFTSILLALTLGSGQNLPAGDVLNRDVLDLALSGYERAVESGAAVPMSVLTIIDYSQPSTRPRFLVYDPETDEVILASLVAHGKNSGQDLATKFGNEIDSLQSSLGFFVTGDTYYGRHGYSLRLHGLEPGINDNAFQRDIVIHGASYVSEDYAARNGRLGRSWGCPALPLETSRQIIDLIKGGSCVFIFGKDSTYSEKSLYVRLETN